jgi:hypothetical protein
MLVDIYRRYELGYEKLWQAFQKIGADRFDGDGIKLDRAVFNPSRAPRLYGTLAAKGDDTQERPHRMSKIVSVPTLTVKITEEKLRSLLHELQPAKDREHEHDHADDPKHGVFDIEQFLSRYSIAAERTTEADGSTKWTLKECPFNSDHKDAAVFQRPDGRLGFHCFHTSCHGKRWHDFREHFDPTATRQKQQRAKTETEGQGPPWSDPWVNSVSRIRNIRQLLCSGHSTAAVQRTAP